MSISGFKARLKNSGARPNLFEVDGAFPGAGNMTDFHFFCKAAQIPQSTVGVINIPFRGRQLKVPGDRTFEPWTLTIINDEDFKFRAAFEQWHDIINDGPTNIGASNLAAAYMMQWNVHQLSRQGSRIASYQMVDAWPSAIAPIELSYDTPDSIEEFTVTMEYQFWTRSGGSIGSQVGRAVSGGLAAAGR